MNQERLMQVLLAPHTLPQRLMTRTRLHKNGLKSTPLRCAPDWQR